MNELRASPLRALTARQALSPEDKAPVAAFVRSIYLEEYGSAPPMPDIFTVVESDGAILAAMGIEFARPSDGTFQIERTYGIRRGGLPAPVTALNAVQLGRWASKDKAAGTMAVYATVCFGLAIGRVYGFVEHDARVHRLCQMGLGVAFMNVDHRPPNLAELPEANRAYYAKSKMVPYLVDLRQMRDAIAFRIT